jgi:hypothetical protein
LNNGYLCQDLVYEFRCCGEDSGLKSPYSRHYETKEVAAKLKNGLWVGWTFWYGGGKHSDPDSIPWMEDAYFLDVKETEQTVIVREFFKI